MKRWGKEGIGGQKLKLAVQDYMQRKTDLRGGTAITEFGNEMGFC